MLVVTYRRVGHRPVRLGELGTWDARDGRPVPFRGVEVEPFVKVDSDSQPRLF